MAGLSEEFEQRLLAAADAVRGTYFQAYSLDAIAQLYVSSTIPGVDPECFVENETRDESEWHDLLFDNANELWRRFLACLSFQEDLNIIKAFRYATKHPTSLENRIFHQSFFESAFWFAHRRVLHLNDVRPNDDDEWMPRQGEEPSFSEQSLAQRKHVLLREIVEHFSLPRFSHANLSDCRLGILQIVKEFQ